ncbi:S-layer homology domain-containing protein [Paenibacillus sp. YIM B09110]|uniref:S-layer homology domain-containing protein n=1 Tax=Paenibacillus sp. YIM B09110 TaxID=3126102 RepID=UPI00301B90A9
MVFSLISSLFTLPASADAGSDWTHCADEGETCSPSGTKELRFGADTRYVTKIITGDVTCSATGLSVTDPAVGTVKTCDIRDLQLDSSVTANGSGDHRTVTVTFSVYAAQAGTVEDLRSKITVQKTGEETFSPLGTNDIVSDVTAAASSSTFSIQFEQALVGSENMIRIEAEAFEDSSAVPYGQALVIDSIRFGEGTESSPYEIATADQLFKIRDEMGIGDYYKLTEDIDLSGYSSGEGWMPIGDPNTQVFEGSLDGNGYTVRNLTINMPSRNFVGLFGSTSVYAVITNMKLEDVSINANTNVGGLVGSNEGVISNSSVTGTVTGVSSVGGMVGMNYNYAPISNSYAAAEVTANTRGAGGLVGSNDGRISSSHAQGSLSGGSYIGGLVGWNYGNGMIKDSYASGSGRGNDTIGGLVGLNQGYIITSYATGSVSDGWGMGGLVGAEVRSTINNSYYDIPVDNGLGTYVTTEAMKQHFTYVGFDFSEGTGAWGMNSSYNNGFPYLKSAVPSAVISVSVSPSASIVAAGETNQLTAVVVTAGGAAQDVTWTSSDHSNVSVDADGLVTVASDAAAGDYVITATSTADTGKIGTATVKVILNLSDVGINVLGGQITGTSEAMEYSLDSTDGTDGTWPGASDTNTDVAFEAGQLYVREADHPANYRLVASIASAAGAPSGIEVDVSANQITGTTALQEYSTDNGATWANATAPHTSRAFVGGEAVKVRVKATVGELASASTTAIHVATAAGAPSGVSANLSGGQAAVKLVGADLTMEYSRDGGATWQAVTALIAAGTASIDVSAFPNDILQVRTAATTSALASLATSKLNVGSVTSVTVSPATATVVQGANQQLTAAVSVVGGAPRTVTWTSSDNSNIAVDANGFVTVAANAVPGNYTISATSTFDTSKSGSATIAVKAAPAGPSGGGSKPTIQAPIISTDGTLTLPIETKGEVSLDGAVKVSIPAGATNQELQVTITKVLDTKALLTQDEVLASPIFEILKSVSGNFSKSVTLTFVFDPALLKNDQKPAVFYYDETKKVWVEIGGVVNGNHISAEVDHFTKFAVMAVGGAVEEIVDLNDIKGHWAEASIKQAVSSGIVTGYPDGNFKPDSTVTRAEFAVMLMNALKPAGDEAALTFTDAAKIGDWAKKAIAQAVQLGIISGYDDGTFRPDATIARSEMAVMVARTLKLSIDENAVTGFADDQTIPLWAKGAVAVIGKIGIMKGSGANEFKSDAKTTRAEAVTVLLRMLEQLNK